MFGKKAARIAELECRVNELEEKICPYGGHEWVEVDKICGYGKIGDPYMTIVYRCRKCGKIKRRQVY